jgi:hypothetical protein
LQNQKLTGPFPPASFPSWHTRLGSSGPLNRIKALHANALSRFQSNSDRFKLAIGFGKLVNDCQLGTHCGVMDAALMASSRLESCPGRGAPPRQSRKVGQPRQSWQADAGIVPLNPKQSWAAQGIHPRHSLASNKKRESCSTHTSSQ